MEEALEELKKARLQGYEPSDEMSEIVQSAVVMEREIMNSNQYIEELEENLEEARKAEEEARAQLEEVIESAETDARPSVNPDPVDHGEVFGSPFEAFVKMHLVFEEGASVDRSKVGGLWKAFYTGDGSHGNKRNKMYAYLDEKYDIEVDHNNHIKDMRLRSYNERIERYCQAHNSPPPSGQTLLVPKDAPINPDHITKMIIAEWLGSEMGSFHTARQWLKIGRQIPSVRVMLGFRMQHIGDGSTDGRSKSVGRLLAPYVNSGDVFRVDGKKCEMCSRTNTTKSREYALEPINGQGNGKG